MVLLAEVVMLGEEEASMAFGADTAAVLHLVDPIGLLPHTDVRMPRALDGYRAQQRGRTARGQGA